MKEKKVAGRLFVVSAPSGAGKTTLVTKVIEQLTPQYGVKRVVTYTSKQPRPGDVNGFDYHFITEEDFKAKIAANYFVEHSTVYGAYYGFPRFVVEEIYQGANYIVIVDRAGAASLKTYIKEAVLVWIKPPDKAALAARLAHRGQDSAETIAFRLGIAETELTTEAEHFFDHIVINDDLEQAIAELAGLIQANLTCYHKSLSKFKSFIADSKKFLK